MNPVNAPGFGDASPPEDWTDEDVCSICGGPAFECNCCSECEKMEEFCSCCSECEKTEEFCSCNHNHQEVDKQQAVHAAFARIKAPQGTKESIAFIRGAEWQAERTAAPQPSPSAEPVAFAYYPTAYKGDPIIKQRRTYGLGPEHGYTEVPLYAAPPDAEALRKRVAELEAEVERRKASEQFLRSERPMARRLTELEAEVEQYRKDAERYQEVKRRAYVGVNPHAKTCVWTLRGVFEIPGAGFDEAIDAASAEVKS